MKTLALLCIFVLFFTPSFAAPETYVLSGTTPTIISWGTLTVNTYAYGVVFPVAGAKWMWNQNWSNSPVGETIAFFNKFNLPCACKELTLYISADDSFSAYINGNLLKSGGTWNVLYTVPIPASFLNVGQNTFTVVATNSVNIAGVIYGIVGV
jgi:hypothetical protein